MLVRIALAAALLGAPAVLAAAPSDRAGDQARCSLTHQFAPHGKGVTTPIVKCDAKTTDLARSNGTGTVPSGAPVATR